MATSNRREREVAAQRQARQQHRRRAAQQRARRRNSLIAAVATVATVLAAVVALVVFRDDDGTTTADPAATPTASAPETTPQETTPTPSTSAKPAKQVCPAPKGAPPAKPQQFPSEPKLTVDKRAAYTATLQTNCGPIVVDLFADKAPRTVNSFVFLAKKGYFDRSPCHRLTTKRDGIFVLQCGDPTGTGQGGPGYGFGIENPPKDFVYPAGTLAMARTTDPNSNGSQFFLVYDTTTLQDPQGYSVFGRVTKGLDLLRKVAKVGVDPAKPPAPAQKVSIQSVTVKQKA